MSCTRAAVGFFLSTLFLGSYETGFARALDCEFIQEKEQGGKLNAASCSADPEVVYSTAHSPHPRDQHCNVAMFRDYNDYVDFRADLDRKEVTYTEVTGIPKYLQEDVTRDFVNPGKVPLEEAREMSAAVRRTNRRYPIVGLWSSSQIDYFSQITNEIDLANAKTRKVDIVLYGDTGEYQLQVAEGGGPAVIIEYHLMGRHSAVSMRFGSCK